MSEHRHLHLVQSDERVRPEAPIMRDLRRLGHATWHCLPGCLAVHLLLGAIGRFV